MHYFGFKLFLCINVSLNWVTNIFSFKKLNCKSLNIIPMKKRHLGLLFLTGTLIMLLSACEYDYIVTVPEPVAPPAETDTISYSQDIQPFFNKQCVSCHQGGIAPDLREGKSHSALVPDYVVAKDPDNSLLYTKCAPGGSMAPYTPSADLALMKRWINAGAKND
jgi:hypothetical protein